MVMKEVVEDKKIELIRSGTKIPENNVNILDLIDTSQLYWLINDDIKKYNHHNTLQGFINDIVDNITPTTAHNSIKATYTEYDVINGLNEDLRHLRYWLEDNINDNGNKNRHENTNPADNGLKSNNTICAHIVEEKEGWFYEWADTNDERNNYYHIPTEKNEAGSSHTFTGDNNIFKLTKIKHNRKSKTRLVIEVSTSIKINFYIGEGQKKHGAFEANN